MCVASAAARAGGDLREAVRVRLRPTARGLAGSSGRRGFGFLAVDGDGDGGATVGKCNTGWKRKVLDVVFRRLRRRDQRENTK